MYWEHHGWRQLTSVYSIRVIYLTTSVDVGPKGFHPGGKSPGMRQRRLLTVPSIRTEADGNQRGQYQQMCQQIPHGQGWLLALSVEEWN